MGFEENKSRLVHLTDFIKLNVDVANEFTLNIYHLFYLSNVASYMKWTT